MAIKNYNDKHEDVINPYLTHKQAQKLREKLKLKQLKQANSIMLIKHKWKQPRK